MREVADHRLHPLVNLTTAGLAGSVARGAVNGLSVIKIFNLTGVPPGRTGTSMCAFQLWYVPAFSDLYYADRLCCDSSNRLIEQAVQVGDFKSEIFSFVLRCPTLWFYPIVTTVIYMKMTKLHLNTNDLTPSFLFCRRNYGVKTFFRGALIGSARAFPHYGIVFVSSDRINRQFVRKPTKDGMFTVESLFWTYMGGAVGGSLATLITHPMDLVKTRLVVQGAPRQPLPYSGIVDAYIKIMKHEGIYRGLYRGLAASVIGIFCFV